MGSSASKGARAAATGASTRKYPSRPPNTRPPVPSSSPPTSRPPAPPSSTTRTQPGPAAHAAPQVSEAKTPAIDFDARDPILASRLNTLGPVQPNPHFSPTSTSQYDPQRTSFPSSSSSSSEFPADMMTSPPRSAFPDPGDNPAVRLLQARQRIQEEAEEELGAVGRQGFQGRKYVDAGLIQLALMRRQRGEPLERIEKGLGIKKGRLGVLGKGIVEVAHES